MTSPRGHHWSLDRGATVLADGTTRFSVWTPSARDLSVVLLDGSTLRTHRLERDESGVFEGVVDDVRPGTDYLYRLDGNDLPDPVSRSRPRGVHGPSRVVDPNAFRWTDGRWRGRTLADLIIYELHVGTFTAHGTFDDAVDRLADLRDLGVTAIEVMPVAEFPGGRNWGYDGVSLYAPQSTYGGPDGLRRLVDAAHGEGLAVLLDVVYNHLGPEGNYLAGFAPYFSDRHATPWGPGWNLDGAESDEVRRYLVDNARYWIGEFHLDGLRLDAADKIVDLSALHLLEEIATALHDDAHLLGRPVHVIAESDANDPRVIRAPGEGGYGADAQWTDDFHHAVHVALTGERAGYYADFGGTLPVAKTLADRFVHDGHYSPYRRRRFGRPAGDLPGERFVVCVQNHDQIGNRVGGERLATLVSPAALRLAACVLLFAPFVPLLFMGEEHGETNPFLYFVSHGDPDLVAAVRKGRRREFARFGWNGELPDPQCVHTFERSRVAWTRSAAEPHAAVRRLYQDLLHLRTSHPALGAGRTIDTVQHDQGQGIVILTRLFDGEAWRGVFNFSDGARHIDETGPRWRVALSSEDLRYGGDGSVAISGNRLRLAPWSAALLREGDA